MATAAILDFQICEILLADGVWKAQAHNFAKFRHNRRSIAEILRFFEFSRWPPRAILHFCNREILLIIKIQRVETRLRTKFCQNRSIGCEDIKIFRFFKMFVECCFNVFI